MPVEQELVVALFGWIGFAYVVGRLFDPPKRSPGAILDELLAEEDPVRVRRLERELDRVMRHEGCA